MLRKPPDFSVMALSAESRVGMFVVAKLAQRNGIKIALRESIYGGTTAVMLIPSLLIVQESTPHELPAVPLGTTREPEPEPVREPVTEVVPQLDPAPGDRPPLPRRTRQASIAPQLTEDASVAAGDGNTVQPDDAERSRSQLAAFQQGTARAREVEEHGAPAANGHRT